VIERLSARLSYANVVATIALFIALGGTGYAVTTLPRNSVGPRQLRRHAVTGSKIAAHAVTGSRVQPNSLTGGQIDESSLGKVPAASNADHASSADSLGGLSAAQLTDHCPSDTVAYGGNCFESTQRDPGGTDWQTASRQCASAGRRLPGAGELVAFGRQTGIAFPGDEWTSDFAADDTHLITVNNLGDAQERPGSELHPFRCVASLSN
jgi:hypothetical protein